MSRSHDHSPFTSGGDDDVFAVIETGVLRDALTPVSALTDCRKDGIARFEFRNDGLCVEAVADSECGSVTVFIDAAGFERYYRRSWGHEVGFKVSRLMEYLELVDSDDCVVIGECRDSCIRFETLTPRVRYVTTGVDPASIWGRALSRTHEQPVHMVLSGDALNTFFQVTDVLDADVVSLVADPAVTSLRTHAFGDRDCVDVTVTPQRVMAAAASPEDLVTFADLCIAIQRVVPDTASIRYSIEHGRGVALEYTTADGHIHVEFIVTPVFREVTR